MVLLALVWAFVYARDRISKLEREVVQLRADAELQRGATKYVYAIALEAQEATTPNMN